MQQRKHGWRWKLRVEWAINGYWEIVTVTDDSKYYALQRGFVSGGDWAGEFNRAFLNSQQFVESFE